MKKIELPGKYPIKHSQILYQQQLVCPKDEKTIRHTYTTSIDFHWTKNSLFWNLTCHFSPKQ